MHEELPPNSARVEPSPRRETEGLEQAFAVHVREDMARNAWRKKGMRTLLAAFMNTSAALADPLFRQACGRRARPSDRPPHRFGGAHRRDALSSSRRAPAPYCTNTPRDPTAPRAGFATNRHESCGLARSASHTRVEAGVDTGASGSKRSERGWLRGPDLNRRPLGYEMPNG